MPGDPAEPKPDADNPFSPPPLLNDSQDAESTATGLKITIADILFCMFAVSVILMTQFQPWGGYETMEPAYILSGVILALSASVFFTANRRRLRLHLPIASFAPGHCVSMLCAGYLATYLFQFLVSFLEEEYVGAPIHILSALSGDLWATVGSIFILLKTRFAPRWKACFIATAAYGALNAAALGLGYFADPSELADRYTWAADWLFEFSYGGWYLAGIFLLLAYTADFFATRRYDWLHHLGVILEVLGCAAMIFEDSMYYQWLRSLYYQFVP